ncbi:MAG: double zinc ribbon domain-containing protein [Acidobacteriota bacterium]
MLRSLSDSILDVIFPQECGVCGGEVESSDDGIACGGCWNATRVFTDGDTLCIKCGAFLFASNSSTTASCSKCTAHSYDRAFSTGLYEKALSASVLELKTTPNICRRIKRLVAATLDRYAVDGSSIVIPVPLSPRRLRERGFNQAAIIGTVVSKHLGSSFDSFTLIRKVHTPMHRAGMDQKARAMTVKNAFEVVRPKLVENKNILLVDDILTSGETASTCARLLKKSGASTVNLLTIARAA